MRCIATFIFEKKRSYSRCLIAVDDRIMDSWDKKRQVAKVSCTLSSCTDDKYSVTVVGDSWRLSNSERGQESRIVDSRPRHPFIPAWQSHKLVFEIP